MEVFSFLVFSFRLSLKTAIAYNVAHLGVGWSIMHGRNGRVVDHNARGSGFESRWGKCLAMEFVNIYHIKFILCYSCAFDGCFGLY